MSCWNCGLSFEKHSCNSCKFCKKCCFCTRPKYFRSKLSFFFPTPSQKKLNKTARFVSAEIEVAGIKECKENKGFIENIVREWKGNIVFDSTLPQGGFEINTAPAGGDLYVRQITEICDVLEKAEAKINEQCGLHVHIDARDYNYNDLHKLVKIYAAIEPTLFAMTPSNRHNSAYAIKCGDKLEKAIKNERSAHIELKQRVVSAIYGVADSIYREDKRGAGPGTGRYYALNLHSWFYRGTIECRLLDGTLDKKEIIDWGVLWANILDFALQTSDDELSVVMDKTKSYESLVHIVSKNKELIAFIDKRLNKFKKSK